MLHDETENPVDVVKVVEGGLLICAIPIPDDWKPLARFDQVGADQQTGDEAVKLLEQHRFLAERKQFLVKLLEAARQTGHGLQFHGSNSGSRPCGRLAMRVSTSASQACGS